MSNINNKTISRINMINILESAKELLKICCEKYGQCDKNCPCYNASTLDDCLIVILEWCTANAI